MNSDRATICQLLHSLRVGGAEVLAARLCRELRSRYRFVFACLDEVGDLGKQLRSEGHEVELLGRRPGLDWPCSRRLTAWLRRQRVDLLHVHQCTPFFYGAMARLPFGSPPLLLTEHGRPYPDKPRPKRIVANRFLLRRRDRVVAVGEAVREALIRNEGFATDRVEVIHNGIDLSRFAPEASDRQAVRRELGLDPNDLIIIQVARLDPLKDHATAIRTIDRVARERRNARLLLVGEGPEQNEVQRLVESLGLGRHVRFLGLRRDVGRLLGAADLAFLSSVTEGIPLTVIEAMAAGLPVVATRVGGNAEVVEEGRTGLLAVAGDDEALAEAILRLADDPELRRQFGHRGRERARAQFSDDRMVDAYNQLYHAMTTTAQALVASPVGSIGPEAQPTP